MEWNIENNLIVTYQRGKTDPKDTRPEQQRALKPWQESRVCLETVVRMTQESKISVAKSLVRHTFIVAISISFKQLENLNSASIQWEHTSAKFRLKFSKLNQHKIEIWTSSKD